MVMILVRDKIRDNIYCPTCAFNAPTSPVIPIIAIFNTLVYNSDFLSSAAINITQRTAILR
jgi:hypothetical protein